MSEFVSSPAPAGACNPSLIEAHQPEQARRPDGAGHVSKTPTDPELDDFTRECAIARAAALVEYLHALAEAHFALWSRDGCFSHKAAYDLALADYHSARGILERLERGRSPAQIARMTKGASQ